MDRIDEELAKLEVNEGFKSRITLEPGKHYRGSFWINEYGEIQVQPEQKGTNPTGLKKVKSGDDYSIWTSKKTIRMVMTFPRLRPRELSQRFTKCVTCIMADIFKYKFYLDEEE